MASRQRGHFERSEKSLTCRLLWDLSGRRSNVPLRSSVVTQSEPLPTVYCRAQSDVCVHPFKPDPPAVRRGDEYLVRRVWEHREGVIPGFTSRYGIRRLVYFETIPGPENAIAREKRIKSYARAKKLALIDSLNPDWHDLAEGWYADACGAAP